jgi:multidrug efflux system outer membrane protein
MASALPPATPRRSFGRRAAAPALLTLALAGCASMAPRYESPPLPVPASFAEPAPPGPSAAATGWRAHFADAQLRELIERALANNRDLRTAVLRVEEARASYGIQRADRFPALGVDALGSRARTPGDLNITGRPLVAGQYQAELNLSWEIDFWGRVRSLEDAALQNFLATEEARRAATVSLVAQVADSYLALRELDERLVLARQTLASREESTRIFRRREQLGAISRLDLAQVETLRTQAQALAVQLEQERAAQAHALALLVGAPAGVAPTRNRLDDDAVMAQLDAGLPSDLLVQRPDIVAAEHQLRAAHADIGAARAAFFPRIALTAGYGSASAQLDGLFDAGSRAWTFAPSISLPIFDAGRRRSQLTLAEVRRDLAVAQYEKTIQSAFRDVSDALSARRWLAEQVRIQQSTLATQTERARLAKLRYDNGAAAFLEVLDAQRDLLAAEQQLVQTRRALLSSRVALYAALGGGADDDAGAVSPRPIP